MALTSAEPSRCVAALGDSGISTAALTTLRSQLKAWEKAFESANGGRKPSREDIKKDPAIEAKYKSYHGLQRTATKPQQTRTPTKPRPRANAARRQPHHGPSTTPCKTPSKDTTGLPAEFPGPVLNQPDLTPAFIRRGLGPTPQKDGQVLGIFDIEFSASPSQKSPTKNGNVEASVAATPSKRSKAPVYATPSRTPQSTKRHFLFDAFAASPLKRKREGDDHDDTGEASVTKQRFATPSFLRRSFPLAPISENVLEKDTSVTTTFKKRGLVRSLSSIIEGLRRQEEDRMDEDLDLLRELEEEELGVTIEPNAKPVPKPDAQEIEMPLGPDMAPEASEESEAEAPGLIRKPWKKKGLKRQTRRVVMKPVLHQARKVSDVEAASNGGPTGDDLSEDGSDAEDFAPKDGQGRTGPTSPADDKTNAPAQSTGKPAGKQAAAAQKPRMISAQAHANFRKLNIKNKNSKANGRGRFGRR